MAETCSVVKHTRESKYSCVDKYIEIYILSHSVPLSAYSSQTNVKLDDSRSREANIGWVWGLLSGQWDEQVEREAWP